VWRRLPRAGVVRAYWPEHYLWVASAMDRIGEHEDSLWDESDGFFYDVLRLPDGGAMRMKVRSLVGLLPFCATTVIYPDILEKFPELRQAIPRTQSSPCCQHFSTQARLQRPRHYVGVE
jgi:hypothetical protein